METTQIINWNIQESKLRIREDIKSDNLVISFTRIAEDLRKYKNPNFYGRLSEMFFLLYPYSNISETKEIFEELKKSNLISKDGLKLDNQEISYVKNFIKELDKDCKLNKLVSKNKIEIILTKLVEKYFPNSSKLIEHYLLGKLISSVGGVKNLYRKPSSTIQLIGAEKALFRHMSVNKPSPKYGLIYYSEKIRQAKEKNKGKVARQLANKLAIAIKVDYFHNFQKKSKNKFVQ